MLPLHVSAASLHDPRRVFCLLAGMLLQLRGTAGSDNQRNAGAKDSIEKLHKVLELCSEIGVITQPAQLGRLLLVPLLSWHHKVSATCLRAV